LWQAKHSIPSFDGWTARCHGQARVEPNGRQRRIEHYCHVTNELSMPSKSTLNVSLILKLTALSAATISTGQDPGASQLVWGRPATAG
jgi:hypothetical protein